MGQHRGGYRLLGLLGEGGMGEVYQGKDREGREVAIKVLRRDRLAHDHIDEFTRRLWREGDYGLALRHRNIAEVQAVDRDEHGGVYLVMELLRGQNLRDLLREASPLAPDVVAAIGHDVALALDAVHRLGMVHRDVKPSNIFLAEEGSGAVVKLCDFGIVRKVGATADETTLLTGAKQLVGSPPYLSPEQTRFESIDHRSDLWSLSVVLWEALAGKHPWAEGNDQDQLFYAIQNRPPPPLRAQSGRAQELCAVIEHGLQKDRRERIESAAELAARLKPFARKAPLLLSSLRAAPSRPPLAATTSHDEASRHDAGQDDLDGPTVIPDWSRRVGQGAALVAIGLGIGAGGVAALRPRPDALLASGERVAPSLPLQAAAPGAAPANDQATAARSSLAAAPPPSSAPALAAAASSAPATPVSAVAARASSGPQAASARAAKAKSPEAPPASAAIASTAPTPAAPLPTEPGPRPPASASPPATSSSPSKIDSIKTWQDPPGGAP